MCYRAVPSTSPITFTKHHSNVHTHTRTHTQICELSSKYTQTHTHHTPNFAAGCQCVIVQSHQLHQSHSQNIIQMHTHTNMSWRCDEIRTEPTHTHTCTLILTTFMQHHKTTPNAETTYFAGGQQCERARITSINTHMHKYNHHSSQSPKHSHNPPTSITLHFEQQTLSHITTFIPYIHSPYNGSVPNFHTCPHMLTHIHTHPHPHMWILLNQVIFTSHHKQPSTNFMSHQQLSHTTFSNSLNNIQYAQVLNHREYSGHPTQTVTNNTQYHMQTSRHTLTTSTHTITNKPRSNWTALNTSKSISSFFTVVCVL